LIQTYWNPLTSLLLGGEITGKSRQLNFSVDQPSVVIQIWK